MKLQESIMSDLDAMAREHSDVYEFIKEAICDEYFNLKPDKDTIEFLKDVFASAHRDLDMKPTQVTEVLPKDADAGEYIADFEKSKAPQFKGKSKKKRKEMAIAAFMNKQGKMKKEDILQAVKEVLAEKKATYCGRCGHTHVKGTPCPRPFKEGLSPYGDDAYFVAPNKGKKMTKEDILKIVKEVLAENVAYDIESTDGTKTVQSFANDAEATAFKSTNTNIKAVKKLEEEDLDLGHQDDEPHMIKSELYKVAKYALELYKIVDQFEGMGEVDFPAWWQAKITKATSMISSAKHYLEFELSEPAVDSMVGADQDSTIAEGEYMWKDQPKDRYSSTLRNKEMLNQVGSAIGELTDLAIEKGQYKPHPEKGVSRTYTTRGIIGQLVADQLRGFVDRYEEDLKGIKILDKAGYATYEPVWKDKEPESIVGPDPRVGGSLDEKLDPVGHEDEDVDNDGKKNTKTDKYIKNKRVKIGAAIAQAKKK